MIKQIQSDYDTMQTIPLMKKMILMVCIFMFISFFGFGQAEGEDILSPYVSRLKAEVNEMSIVLTWKNPEETEGKILIYRHTGEITETNINSAQLLMIADMSKESYLDSPGDTKEYYYAILVQDTTSKIHKVFFPYRNKTVTGVRITFITPEEDLATKITDLRAVVRDNSIIISFQSSKPSRYVLLYRSTSPLIDEDSLIQAPTPVTLEDFSYKYTDYPIAGIDYYYAVLDAGLVKIGTIRLVPGQNSLINPVTIPLKGDLEVQESATKRSLPLPYLDLISDIEFGKDIISSVSSYLPEKRKIDDSTEKTIKNTLSHISLKQEEIIMEPSILPVDTAESTGSESSILQKIISEYFIPGLFYKAEIQLRDYLKIKHSKEVEARSYYYLGQVFYFKGAYKDSFLAFIMAQELYYTEIQPWLNACFNKFYQDK